MRGTLAALPARCRGPEWPIEWTGANTWNFRHRAVWTNRACAAT